MEPFAGGEHGTIGEAEAVGVVAAARGVGSYFRVSRIPETFHAYAGDHAGIFAHGIPCLFCLHRRGAGVFWRTAVDRGAIHKNRGAVALGGNGGGAGEGPRNDFEPDGGG